LLTFVIHCAEAADAVFVLFLMLRL